MERISYKKHLHFCKLTVPMCFLLFVILFIQLEYMTLWCPPLSVSQKHKLRKKKKEEVF